MQQLPAEDDPVGFAFAERPTDVPEMECRPRLLPLMEGHDTLRSMRIRLPELLDERNMTAYALSRASGDRISMSTAYRLMRMQGRVQFVDMQLLDSLCDTLRVGPAELFDREETAHSKQGRSKRR